MTKVLWNALVLVLTGLVLYAVEHASCGFRANTQIIPIITLSTFFFAYNILSVVANVSIRKHRPSLLTTYYLANSFLQFLLTVCVFIIYALFVRNELLLFAINTVVYFFVALVATTVAFVRLEKNKK